MYRGQYRGRFAPSPTGPLHFGSLVAALAGYLDARRVGGEWLVRMEDVDGERSRADAASAILSTLDAFGFRMDGTVVYQSQRTPLYRAELARLTGHTFDCACSRKDIGEAGGGRYPGTCRRGVAVGKTLRQVRLRVTDETLCFEDRLQGRFCSNLEQDLGDFPILRLDTGIYSYQFAVVVDDNAQGITDIVRGADLLDSTPRQIYLQRLLGYGQPRYLHVPVATGPNGEKLSKQNLAPAIAAAEAALYLYKALCFLGQSPPENFDRESPGSIWGWAIANWQPARIPACLESPAL